MRARSFVRVLAAAALAACLVASSASAQTREGFYFGLGGGAGRAEAPCDQCGGTGRETGGVGYVAAGWALNRHVVVAGELDVWTRRNDAPGITSWVYRYNVSAVALLYPSARSGFFVKGGAGVSYADADRDFGESTIDVELGSGPGFVVGAGIDVPLGRVALTPAVSYWHGRLDDLEYRGIPYETDRRQRVVAVTLGVTFP